MQSLDYSQNTECIGGNCDTESMSDRKCLVWKGYALYKGK